MKRFRPFILFCTGAGIFWLGIDASARIYETFEIACELDRAGGCSWDISTDLILLRWIVVICAFTLPVALHRYFVWKDRDEGRAADAD